MALNSASNVRARILLLIDVRGWAFDTIAQAIKNHLSERFHFDILASGDLPTIDASQYDLIHVFYFGERYHLPFLLPSTKVLKSVYSYRWKLKGLSPGALYAEHLREARAITVPNTGLLSLLSDLPVPVFLTPEGVDTHLFWHSPKATGPLIAGWVGNAKDSIKQLPLAIQACENFCQLRVADGSIAVGEMPAFYRSIDILLCSSIAEGSPRPLIEAMASGVFPVTFPVGVARELIVHGVNGYIVEDRTAGGLRDALSWCHAHRAALHDASERSPKLMLEKRRWEVVTEPLAAVYDSLLL